MSNKLNNDLIARYGIYLAAKKMDADVADNKLTDNERALVAKEISDNPELSEYIDFLEKSYTELYQDLGKSAFGEITLQTNKTKHHTRISRWSKMPTVRYTSTAIIFLLLAIISVRLVSEIITPNYYPIIQESLDIKLPVARGGGESSLETGKDLFNKGIYYDAITTFRDQINESQSVLKGETAISAYYLGLTYLKHAQKSIIGLFPTYNSAYVDSSSRYLEIAHSRISNHIPLQRDVLLYLGIVETLHYSNKDKQEHYVNAEKHLNFLEEHHGKHTEMARKLLNKLKVE